MVLSDASSRQCNFSTVGGKITWTDCFKTGFYGLGDMLDEFQRVTDSMVGHLRRVYVYLKEILITTRVSMERHWQVLRKILHEMKENTAAVKWIKCTNFAKEIIWLRYKLSNKGTVPLKRKVDSMKKQKTVMRSLTRSINQLIRFIQNLTATIEPFRDLMTNIRGLKGEGNPMQRLKRIA